MRVFVLNTGRCRSVTFSRACSHLTNYSAGHETLARNLGHARFAFPDQHIETDNRLAWFLAKSNFGSARTHSTFTSSGILTWSLTASTAAGTVNTQQRSSRPSPTGWS